MTKRTDSFIVPSSDGTPLTVWTEGDGPPIVLVHGSLRDHTIFAPLVAALRSQMTTCAVDRRGFGTSGDAKGYAIAQEFRDVAIVVDAIAARSGPVVLFGHSYGAGCAMGAATLTANVSRLVLYEPGLGIAYPHGWIEARERELAAGDNEVVIRAVLRDILEMSEEEITARTLTPRWREYLAAAPTGTPRESDRERLGLRAGELCRNHRADALPGRHRDVAGADAGDRTRRGRDSSGADTCTRRSRPSRLHHGSGFDRVDRLPVRRRLS